MLTEIREAASRVHIFIISSPNTKWGSRIRQLNYMEGSHDEINCNDSWYVGR